MDITSRALAAIEELSARYQRHSDSESECMACMRRGWLQAISLFTGIELLELKKQLDSNHGDTQKNPTP